MNGNIPRIRNENVEWVCAARGLRMTCVTLALASRVELAAAQQVESRAAPGTAPADAGASLRGPASDLVAPEVVERRAADYPAAALAQRREGTVELLLTVERDGSVSHVQVARSAGVLLDQAAIDALKQWTFRAAKRGGEPVSAKIRVPFEFVLPPAAAPLADPQTAAQKSGSRGPTEPSGANVAEVIEVEVHVERRARAEQRAASDFQLSREIVSAAPRREGADVLASAPGMYLARTEGLAVAHRYMLRGFDAEHGQDLEIVVGGLPINLPSHIHGQGYADLGFLIADTVQEVRATEGVYDPWQGDFAVAGSIDVRLGMEARGWQAKASLGSFGSRRQLLTWAPEQLDEHTFAAIHLQDTDGFGDSRQGRSASAIAQWGSSSGEVRYRLLSILHAARADLAGVVRADDVDAGRVGFYSVYPLATARAQNAIATRALLGFFAEYRGAGGESLDASVWLGLDNFRLQENFTGFIQQSQTLANVAGRGDLIEQLNRTRSLGASARYRTPLYRPAEWALGSVELGLSGRIDDVEQAQNLIDAVVRSQTWDRRVDACVLGSDIAAFGDIDWHFTHRLTLRAGLRADVLAYAVDDRLGNRVTLTRPDDTFIVGFRRSALGLVWGPRASVEVRPIDDLAVRAAYGEGYRSPQARTLDDGEEAPFTKVRSADLGLRFGDSLDYQLTLSGYYTHLSDDVAFEAEEGRLERIGATRRMGVVAHAELFPAAWLLGAVSVTFVDAELLEPPPGSVEEPEPPFRAGQNLPFVPPLVARADIGAKAALVEGVAGADLVGRAGLGFSFLSPRPLPYGEFGDSVALVDAALGLGWGPLTFDVEGHNLLGDRYAATELNFASHWDPETVRARTPARHITAGPPRSWMFTLGVAL